ncbi:DNA polymerase III subunit gamma/tau [Christensenella tenuis]|uniref:DNA-directed DNA polymerase n=1 Tax=Christensenella tenuis TaxID=2763033 RepID=A0ABR7EFF0_9FIRM|nr:DNA polymerase III subunit gamma/tau [Christensenella tenuis]MBC5647769.1 DNA polymerase III subunit gamma/tau [Christensenella tenuis]
MAYKTLYRVFRPKTFDEVYGQQHITDILKKQVMTGQLSHAYLFYGPRGTGKTSTAKILANAMNCLAPQDGNPCGKCEVCTGVANDAFVDIVEIDAASNNSVDNVRDIREKVSLLPALGKYKVYIIDEVHMLSPGAFNALLKTLEEPPAHAVFILATTEIRKLPATILSRCQRYDFKRITEEDIIGRLREVAEKTGIAYEEEALTMIAQSAEGAMRDALSVMDQCIAGQDALTLDHVNEAMGIADAERTRALCEAVLDENPSQALQLLHGMLRDGIEPHNILRDIIVELSGQLAKEAADAYKCANLLRVLEVFIYNQNILRYAATPDAVLIAAVARAAINTTDADTEDMELRLKKLEARVEKLAANLASGQLAAAAAEQPPAASPKEVPVQAEIPGTQELKGSAIEELEQQEEDGKTQRAKEQEPLPEAGEALKQLRAKIEHELPVLAPAAAAIREISAKGNLLKFIADAADSVLVDMLCKEEYLAQMNEITAEIFGHTMVLETQYEQKEEKSMEQQLFDLFGKDKVVIK